MARIYKLSDRIKVKIDDVTITIAPLSHEKKVEASDLMTRGTLKQDIKLLTEGVLTCIRYGLKKVSGVQYMDGSDFELEFENGAVTEKCIDELLNLEISAKLQAVCSSLIQGVPKSNELDGVEIIQDQAKKESVNPN